MASVLVHLENEISKLKKDVKAKNELNSIKTISINEMAREAKEKDGKIQELRIKGALLMSEKQAITRRTETEKQKLRDQIAALEQKHESEIAALNQELESVQDTFKGQVEQLQESAGALSKTVEETEGQINSYAKQVVELELKVQTSEDRIKELEDKEGEQDSQVHSYSQKVVELEAKNYSAETQMKELQDTNAVQAKKVEEQDAQIASYAEKVLEFEAKLVMAETQVNELQGATEKVQELEAKNLTAEAQIMELQIANNKQTQTAEEQGLQVSTYASQVLELEANNEVLKAKQKELLDNAEEDLKVISELKNCLESQEECMKKEVSQAEAKAAKAEEALEHITQQLEASRSEEMRLKIEKDVQYSQISSLEERNFELETNVEALRKDNLELQMWKDKRQNLDQSLTATKAKLEEFRKINLELVAQTEELHGQNDALIDNISAFETKQDELLKTVATQKTRIRDAKKKNSGLLDKLGEQKKRYAAETRYWKEMNERLYETTNSTQQKLADSKSAEEDVIAKNEDLQQRIKALTEQAFELETQKTEGIFEVEAANKSLLRTNEKLNGDIEKVVAESEKLNQRICSLEQDKENNENAIKRLNGKIDGINTENEDLRAQLHAQREKRFAVEKGAKNLEHLNEGLAHSLEDTNKQRIALSAHLQDMKKKFDGKLAEWKSNYDESRKSNKELKASLKASKKEIAAQEARLLTMQVEHQATTLKGAEDTAISVPHLVMSEDESSVSTAGRRPEHDFTSVTSAEDDGPGPLSQSPSEVSAPPTPRKNMSPFSAASSVNTNTPGSPLTPSTAYEGGEDDDFSSVASNDDDGEDSDDDPSKEVDAWFWKLTMPNTAPNEQGIDVEAA